MTLRREDLVIKGLELLKKDGIDGITLRKLAIALNIQAASLYTHIKNKRDLIDEMAESLLQKEFKDLQSRKATEAWQNWLTEYAKRLRKAMLAYPDGGRLVSGAHFYPTVTLLRILDCAIGSLRSAGLDVAQTRHIVLSTVYYTFGYVIEEQAAPSPAQLSRINSADLYAQFPYMLESFNDRKHSNDYWEDDFLAGLKLIIENRS